MNLKKLLYFAFVNLLILSSCSTNASKEKVKKQPNIVIVFLDDSGYSDFSPFGQSKIVTPNVQKLFKN